MSEEPRAAGQTPDGQGRDGQVPAGQFPAGQVPDDRPRPSSAGAQDPDPERITDRSGFGRELTAVRERAGLTIRGLADRVDVPYGTLGGWFRGANLPSVSQLGLFETLLVECGVGEVGAREEWGRALLRIRRAPGRRPSGAPVPYRGLESYQPEHAEWYFGRDGLVRLAVERLLGGCGPLVVVGPSGSGKSSLLRAGVIPALRDHVPVLLFTPGDRPVGALAACWAAHTGRGGQEVEASLCADPDGWPGPDGAGHVVVVVDQFEEVFTASDEGERQTFLRALSALSGTGARPVGRPPTVVLGLRADFFAQAARHPWLAEVLQDNQLVVGPMSRDQLREAIVGPARRARVDVQDALVEMLLQELAPRGSCRVEQAHDPGALPLLSHALLTTWEKGRQGVMTVEDYLATGGVEAAVARTAEAVVADLTEEQQAEARRLFRRLVHLGGDTAVTRRRMRLDELPGGGEGAVVHEVLDRFTAQRLITAEAATVEISHEALLAAWPRLRSWVEEDRAGLRVHRRITEAAEAWRDSRFDPAVLHRGGRLAEAREWAADPANRADLNAVERRFLDAGIAQDEAEREAARRRTRRLHRLVAALMGLLVLVGGLSGYSSWKSVQADRARDVADSRQVATTADRLRTSDPALSAQLSLAAYRISPSAEARAGVLTASSAMEVTRIVRPSRTWQAVAVSGDGRLMAAGGASDSDPTVLLWSLADRYRPKRLGPPLRGHTRGVLTAAFSPDGRLLATAGEDSVVRLWDLTDPARPRPLRGPATGLRGRVLSVQFSPDGGLLAAAGADRVVRLWTVKDPGRVTEVSAPVTGGAGALQSVAFSPRGRSLLAAAGEAGQVHLWDVGEPARPRRIGRPLSTGSKVNAVSFGPDGRTLAAGSNDGAVRFWDVAGPGSPEPSGEPVVGEIGMWVNAVAHHPDGRLLAVAGADGTVRVWDLVTRRPIVTLPHPQPATAVVFRGPQGDLVTNGADGIVRVWSLPGPVVAGTGHPITTIAFRPGGAVLAAAGGDIRLWDVTDAQHPVALGPALTAQVPGDRLNGNVAISPDGRLLAGATRAGADVLLWDLADPRRPVRVGPPMAGARALIENLQFSPDGRTLAAAGDDGAVRLWDVADPRAPVPLSTLRPGAGFLYMLAFSPDGRLLAVAAQSGEVLLWDVADPRRPVPAGVPLPVSRDLVYSVVFSNDGRTLAAGSSDSIVTLWRIDGSGRPVRPGRTVTGSDGRVHSLAFAPGDRTLAAGTGTGQIWLWDTGPGHDRPRLRAVLRQPDVTHWYLAFGPDGATLAAADGDVRLWNTDLDRAVTHLCARLGDPLTSAEWSRLEPGIAFRPPCER
ncbi:MAG: hypothetical protein QG622_2909 [Actinomycetota bacterium]|nr:hypothetical protein [Actinomycetota bacterium]